MWHRNLLSLSAAATLVLFFAPGLPPYVEFRPMPEVERMELGGPLENNSRLDEADRLTNEIDSTQYDFFKVREETGRAGVLNFFLFQAVTHFQIHFFFTFFD